MNARLDEIEARAQRAHLEVVEMCRHPRVTWRMSIPANPERDSDLVIEAALDDLAASVKALRAALAVHAEHIAPLVRAGRSESRCLCLACDMARAITAALDAS